MADMHSEEFSGPSGILSRIPSTVFDVAIWRLNRTPTAPEHQAIDMEATSIGRVRIFFRLQLVRRGAFFFSYWSPYRAENVAPN